MWYQHSVNSEPKLGIVIAAYNAERFLTKTLESIRNMTYRNFQCIIVNDGSTDSSGTIASLFTAADDRFSAVTINNAGPCVARNHGYDRLDEDVQYVVFTDADDVIFPDTYSRFIDILERELEYVAVHGLGTFITEHDQVDKTEAFERVGLARKKLAGDRIADLGNDEPTTFESLVLSSTVFPPGLVVHRKSILTNAGLFDLKSRYAEDWDLLLRVTRFGDIKFIPIPVLYYRRHQNNVGTSPQVPLAVKNVWTKTYYSPCNNESHRCLLRVAFIAKNKSELKQYVMCLFRYNSEHRKFRCIKGIIGSIIRLMSQKPARAKI
jgi:glycosyltransferase involved in cell wall biosynthesis